MIPSGIASQKSHIPIDSNMVSVLQDKLYDFFKLYKKMEFRIAGLKEEFDE